MAAMIGLGVGIDYALFIVSRYREHLHAGDDPETATIAAVDSSGRAVIFAGLTVMISLLGQISSACRSSAAWRWPGRRACS